MYQPPEKPVQHQPAPSAFPPLGQTAPPPPGPDAYHQPPEKPNQQPPPGQYVASSIPVGSQMNNPQPGYWSTGLCDCFSDAKSCCLVCWCPCVAFGQLSEIVDKGDSSCCRNGCLYLCLCALGALGTVFGVPSGCQWLYSCTYRSKIKQGLGMPPSCCEECCIHFWCEPCALCQEYREIQKQGYDLSLGWNGNVEKMRQGGGNRMPATVAAPVAPSMAR